MDEGPRPPHRLLAPLLLACVLGAASANAERVIENDADRPSAHFMAQAIATTGWYTMEDCPASDVEERSDPGCARIPTEVTRAVEWLDRIDEHVFEGTVREGAWQSAHDLVYATWRFVVTGQRYLLVLAPHPNRAVTLLYVSELAAAP